MTCSRTCAAGHDRYVPSDRVTEAADELYAADPAGFTEHRKALADAARADGDKEVAKRIAALRKPTRAAWILNHLARADPDAPGRLATLASGLRAATQAKDGRRLRELSADRGALIDTLTGQALAAAGVADPPAGLREDMAATLASALADPDIAGQFATGTLTRAAQWAGFGLVPAPDTPDERDSSDGGDSPDDEAERASTMAPKRDSRSRAVPKGTDRARQKTRERAQPPPSRAAPVRESPRSKIATTRADAGTAPPRETPPHVTPPAKSARARAAEDTAARRRKAFDDAKRSLAAAMKAAIAAGSAEDQLEATVRDLEQRLTTARKDLADARLRARRAESAERKASQALDRLPRP
jgi:hypothetical protein